MSDDLPPLHKLAHDLLHETLHGAPPVETTMRLAEGILAIIDRCERAERERDEDVGRLQRVVYEALCDAVKGAIPDANLSRIDGGASDGDEFEFTEAEVSIACGMLEDEIVALRGERDTLRAKVGELEAHLRRVLDVERESAVRAGLSGCTCMTKSRADERAYETGTCPHQLADTALRSPK